VEVVDFSGTKIGEEFLLCGAKTSCSLVVSGFKFHVTTRCK
jgi:hypothetical protein